MIDREHELPLTQQCRILNLSRSGIYYLPAPVSDKDRELMRLIDEIHLECPYAGTRGIRNELWNRGHKIGRSHVRTLMQKMDIEARLPETSPLTPPPGAHGLPLSPQRTLDHRGQSRVVCGHNLHPHA